MKIIFLLSVMLLYSLNILAQQASNSAINDAMRNSGKIYVVVTVMTIVFVGIIAYLFTIDKRLKKIENKN